MKRFPILWCILVLLCLSGCNGAMWVSAYGNVVDYRVNAATGQIIPIIRKWSGNVITDELVTLLPDETMKTDRWIDGYTIEEVQATYPNGVVLSAASEIGVEEEEVTTMVTCTDGTQIKAYTLGEVKIADWCVEPDAFTFSDGTTADLWKSGYYYLKDGVRLMRAAEYQVPDIRYDTEEARKKILQFYAERGLLYETDVELERAYEVYQTRTHKRKNFFFLEVSQSILPSYANRKIITYCTFVDCVYDNYVLYHTFDRSTGEPISNYDLFTVPPEEVLSYIISTMRFEVWEDDVSIEEMQAALKPEYIALSDKGVSFRFPYGIFPGLSGYEASIRKGSYENEFSSVYTGELLSMLQPWARPTQLKT